MIIDVHCHVGFSSRRVDPTIRRFSFEQTGAVGRPGYDSYLSSRFLRRPAWFLVRRWLGIDPKLGRGAELDAQIEAINERHWSNAESVDRLVLLAFDEYHDDGGTAVGAADRGRRLGSDLYVSNSLVRGMCTARPDRFLFGGSIHPYRVRDGRNACDMLAELAHAGAVLIKWLPIHQNIRAEDPRTVAFLRKAAQVGMPMLIHYGGEMSVSRQHMEFESPVPLLGVLRRLRAESAMPTVIVAHAATPSFIWQSAFGHRALVDALLGEFADAPLYADISALTAFGRTRWLRRLASRKELHGKLVWGSDYPVPVMLRSFKRVLGRPTWQQISTLPSWIEQSLRLPQALGFEQRVFTQAATIVGGR
jgi:predicted TIM-barrel fold metal-dependent hydrolase